MPLTTEGRLGQLEQRGAVMAQQISDINRVLDRVVPYGESLVEVRGMLNGLKNDVEYVRSETAEIKQLEADNKRSIAANEEQRRKDDDDRRAAVEEAKVKRRNQTLILVGTIITTVGGVFVGAHPL
jgi:hypothetical protein